MPMCRKISLLACLLCLSLAIFAQERPKFDPARFEAELEQFITVEAGFTPQDASKFFPLYREMRTKQRYYFDQMRKYDYVDFENDKQCAEAIEQKDKLDLVIKELQQQYHAKFMRVLPPKKVYKAIRAEDKFHKRAFHRIAKRGKKQAK